MKLKEITESSYIVYSGTGEKVGIVIDYSNHKFKKGLEYITVEGTITPYGSYDELQTVFDSDIEFEKKEITETELRNVKFLDEYPINETDELLDVLEPTEDSVVNVSTFRKSKRSKKRFYPGWWITKSENKDEYVTRLTLSTDIVEERIGSGELHGPYKTHMEVTFNLNELQKPKN